MSEKEKVPFYKSALFLALISVLFPIAGIVMMWIFKKKWHAAVKIILTVIASVWCMFLSLILLGMSLPADETTSGTVSDTTEYTTSVYETETTTREYAEETITEIITVTTTEETSETTTKPTTTKKESTTTKPTTTKKEITTTKPTTTKKETTTAKPTTTKKETTTKRVTTTVNPDSQKTVYITPSGEKYHYENPCGRGTYKPISLADAKARGYDACEKCVLH